ncbi:hypothetical protein WJX73_001806 [Symbiochloris irregularis]|uniref:Uncharacterized protein n=1 Tax=Symbiochloris irregularis TaxID=706552 RepID=A0AAW1PCK4_9CHLO
MVAGLTSSDAAAAQQRDGLLSGKVPIVLPEKLATNKYIVELEPTGDGADDLTGDAGAVGRVLVAGKGEEAELRLDLKGVVYAAALVPSACTLAVVNISGTEARVEAMASQFLQLTRERDAAGGSTGGDGDNHFMWDDDDNYQVGAAGAEEPQKKAGGKRKADQDDVPAKKRRQTTKGSKPSAKRKSSKPSKPKAKKK